jgi:hypothetical protein
MDDDFGWVLMMNSSLEIDEVDMKGRDWMAEIGFLNSTEII